MRSKQLIFNLIIILGYFLFFLINGYGQSGGDIFVVIMTIISVLIHLLGLVIFGVITKKKILKGVIGMLIGMLINAVIFGVANYMLTHR